METEMPKATWAGKVIAESNNCVVVEGNQYFPPDGVKQEFLKPSSHTTVCPWKGTAHYFHVEVDGMKNDNAAWYYRSPRRPPLKSRTASPSGKACASKVDVVPFTANRIAAAVILFRNLVLENGPPSSQTYVLSMPTSFSGSPVTARYPRKRGSQHANLAFMSSIPRLAKSRVIASIGVMPNPTMRRNSCAWSRSRHPAMSVPNTIFKCACSAFLNEPSCTAARARSRFPPGVSAGAQSP